MPQITFNFTNAQGVRIASAFKAQMGKGVFDPDDPEETFGLDDIKKVLEGMIRNIVRNHEANAAGEAARIEAAAKVDSEITFS